VKQDGTPKPVPRLAVTYFIIFH